MEFVHTSYLLKGNESVHTDLKGLLKGLSVESVYTLYLLKGNLKGNLFSRHLHTPSEGTEVELVHILKGSF